MRSSHAPPASIGSENPLEANVCSVYQGTMSVTIETDQARRRATATVPPGTSWATFERAALAAVNATPELADWNWIIDDQGPIDDVDVGGMVRIGEAFCRLASAAGRNTHTVVVTTDRFFDTWARVIDLNYGERRHHGAPTLTAAIALLDRLEGGVDV